MAQKTIICKFGEVAIRTAMFDVNGTDLVEGIEIKGDEFDLIEIWGYHDIAELSKEQVEQIIEKSL